MEKETQKQNSHIRWCDRGKHYFPTSSKRAKFCKDHYKKIGGRAKKFVILRYINEINKKNGFDMKRKELKEYLILMGMNNNLSIVGEYGSLIKAKHDFKKIKQDLGKKFYICRVIYKKGDF
jgi:hypothetical protein